MLASDAGVHLLPVVDLRPHLPVALAGLLRSEAGGAAPPVNSCLRHAAR